MEAENFALSSLYKIPNANFTFEKLFGFKRVYCGPKSEGGEIQPF